MLRIFYILDWTVLTQDIDECSSAIQFTCGVLIGVPHLFIHVFPEFVAGLPRRLLDWNQGSSLTARLLKTLSSKAEPTNAPEAVPSGVR
jgi:hypothetical protein